jgi:poly-beta-1,6-N-acetyl-D-glucosamine synthase
MFFIALVLLLIYLLLLVLVTKAWTTIPQPALPIQVNRKIKVSILVALRNEEKNIQALLTDLQKQDFDPQNLEILLINDHSEDNTLAVVQDFAKKFLVLKIFTLPPNLQGKKQAITYGVGKATGELILCTDGDCRVGERWVTSIHNFYVHHQPKLISSAIEIDTKTTTAKPSKQLKSQTLANFFAIFQALDSMSLVSIGAASLHWGVPTMCNGANLAYTKAVFEEVNGFVGNEHLASGDDEFLLRKVAARYPNDVKFLKQKQALVSTKPQADLPSFIAQRKRWASKWQAHKSLQSKALAVFIFAFHAFSLLLPLLCVLPPLGIDFLQLLPLPMLTSIFWAAKIGGELYFFALLIPFFGHPRYLCAVPLASIVYPFYAFSIGLASQNKKFFWKGRHYSNINHHYLKKPNKEI